VRLSFFLMTHLSKQGINRRRWLAASGLAALGGCFRNRGTGFYGYALVACAGDNSLTVVDLAAFRPVSSIALSGSPSQVLAAPVSVPERQAYTVTPANGMVHVIDSKLAVAKSRRIADQVSQIGLAKDGQSLLALVSPSRELIQTDLATLQNISHHKLSLAPDAMDSSGNGYAAVASAAGAVELVQLSSGKRWHAQTPALGAIRFRKDGNVLLAANLQNRSLLVLAVPSLQTVVELPLAMQPDHLCFNDDQGQLFISGTGMDGVAVVFPFDAIQVDQTLLAGRAPGAMACSASPAYLFVGSNTGSDVCILNIDTRKVIGIVETGGRPSLIKVTPDSNYVLVFNEGAGDMGVIRIPAIKVTGDARRLKTGASLFTMLSVGAKPVDAAIIPHLA
jgi:DNA-binding beta-propeller fold protein YncE